MRMIKVIIFFFVLFQGKPGPKGYIGEPGPEGLKVKQMTLLPVTKYNFQKDIITFIKCTYVKRFCSNINK